MERVKRVGRKESLEVGGDGWVGKNGKVGNGNESSSLSFHKYRNSHCEELISLKLAGFDRQFVIKTDISRYLT